MLLSLRSAGLSLSKVAVVSLVYLYASGCSDTTLGSFSAEEAIPTVTIPGVAGIAVPLQLTLPDVALDVTQTDAYRDTNRDFVTFVRLRTVALELDASTDSDPREDGNLDDFDFLQNIEIYLNATFDGEPRQALIAQLPEGDPQIGSGTRQLTLATTSVDVLDYIEATEGYTLSVTVAGTVPPDNVIVKGTIGYRVGIGFR